MSTSPVSSPISVTAPTIHSYRLRAPIPAIFRLSVTRAVSSHLCRCSYCRPDQNQATSRPLNWDSSIRCLVVYRHLFNRWRRGTSKALLAVSFQRYHRWGKPACRAMLLPGITLVDVLNAGS